ETLAGFDCDDLDPALGALGAALDYLERNQVSLPPEVVRLRRVRLWRRMHLDAPTQRCLELVEGMPAPGRSPSRGLLGLLDRTRTPMGARTLRGWLLAPLTQLDDASERLDAVAELYGTGQVRQSLERALAGIRDLER